MKTNFIYLFILVILFSCKQDATKEYVTNDEAPVPYDYKVLDSQYINVDELWKPFEKYWNDFTEEDYNRVKPFIWEQNIPTLQRNISNGKISYEELTLFYLFRIKKYDRNNDLSLNSVIGLNPNVVEEAKQKDIELNNDRIKHPIFGMPILLKDNINAKGMPATAGAIVLAENITDDAFITAQLKNRGALILGKSNLSEWAYFFCGDCPSGYSAVGGQTLNAYGRAVLDTGGSSSGSGVATSVNFAVATVGSETSGSILSPSSQNSIVGLKPTIGFLSRSGIVPISSTLDTPGPMTKNVIDNAILLDAMKGYDVKDALSFKTDTLAFNGEALMKDPVEFIKGKRFGLIKSLLENPLYRQAVNTLENSGAVLVEIEPERPQLNGFLTLLNIDMRNDLPKYLSHLTNESISVSSVSDVIKFNKSDSLVTMPYGQKLFYGIVNDPISDEDFVALKDSLKIKGKQFFDVPMKANNLDGILSINNYHAGFAAVAIYPAITVPMGYDKYNKPYGLTFISPKGERELLQWAYGYEQVTKHRKVPIGYE
ncbi:amidase family protein [Urechidicola vernalis]|uniref:Amidase family protein n=1 Tax=Urechidicola vernalis TaxID=3075600 RepID=A0ABU2Y2P0_9FLAO|nr:amidase family protein [Urechidicola sp. P050]MDT0552474.1 amidase family protein [Urechidicola sp. P050]